MGQVGLIAGYKKGHSIIRFGEDGSAPLSLGTSHFALRGNAKRCCIFIFDNLQWDL